MTSGRIGGGGDIGGLGKGEKEPVVEIDLYHSFVSITEIWVLGKGFFFRFIKSKIPIFPVLVNLSPGEILLPQVDTTIPLLFGGEGRGKGGYNSSFDQLL